MEIRIIIGDSPIGDRLTSIEQKLDQVLAQGATQMADLTNITTEVTEISSVVDSAVALIGNLADQIRANATDQTALNDLANSLDAKAAELGAAIAANTPAAG